MNESERHSVPMTNELRLALIDATNCSKDAHGLWERLMRKGASDHEMLAALDVAFGISGGHRGPDGQWHYQGGATPKFWLGDGRAKPTLVGQVLIRAVRMVYGIDFPKGCARPLVYEQQSLFPGD